jgi:hypothetical protein
MHKLLTVIFKFLGVISAVLLASTSEVSIAGNYIFNTQTNTVVQSTGSSRYYSGYDIAARFPEQIELLDGLNMIDLRKGAGPIAFNTDLFTTRDILDITSFVDDQLFMTTTKGNFIFNTSLNKVIQSTGGSRYYFGYNVVARFPELIELVDGLNMIDLRKGAGPIAFNTDLFTTRDILDITSFVDDQLFLTTTKGNFIFNSSLNKVIQSTGGSRYYYGYDVATRFPELIELVDGLNMIDLRKGAGPIAFNTDLFKTSDILDITSFIDDQLFITVRDTQEPTAISLPGTIWLTLAGLGILGLTRKRSSFFRKTALRLNPIVRLAKNH